jgi:hypothetical protein
VTLIAELASVPVIVSVGAGVSCVIVQWPLPVIATLTLVPSPSCTVPGCVSDARIVPSGCWLLWICTGNAASSRTRDSNVSNSTVDAAGVGWTSLLPRRLPPPPRRLFWCLNLDRSDVFDTANFPLEASKACPSAGQWNGAETGHDDPPTRTWRDRPNGWTSFPWFLQQRDQVAHPGGELQQSIAERL